MAFELMNLNSQFVQEYAVNEILNCNSFTQTYGLSLTPIEATALAETRSNALKSNGRVEFGGGIIQKLIKEFCDSPYLDSYNYSETLHELVEIFYCYKNETLDLLSDDELISRMYTLFDGICQGSLDLLAGRELDLLAENLRRGYSPEYQADTLPNPFALKEDEHEQY